MTIGRGRIRELSQQLANKFRRDDRARRRLLSVHGLDFSELNVKMQVGERNTTLCVSSDRMPAFVYQLSSIGVPTEERFYAEVLRMVPEVGRAFGANVGADWHAGSWSKESLATVVAVPTQEVSLDEGPAEAAG
ncbi:hypothetical protein AOZ06_47845 [Kibdelosporangium phytohabitans]|uniref:Uncharacterized protein n=2 Tax=Kibdelosporangium phytohabitans TaxID=860235 RepID=A0A0N9IAX0_9PSEU|nr:hypothetical protein AOZ06_47845 [Kibdelosporangium phytohabitans]